jgi:hypothetical protein
MGTKRDNFPDVVKARAYARDRATCCYGGGSLWVADAGSEMDWCEHRIAASKGGRGEDENALTSCWRCNHKRGNRERPPILFHAGQITPDGEAALSQLPVPIARHFKRMEEIHWTDWFLNRAFCEVLWGAEWLSKPDRHKYSRDAGYRASRALDRVVEWKVLAAREKVSPPTMRGLVPLHSDEGHLALWNVQQCVTCEQLLRSIRTLSEAMENEYSRLDAIPHCSLFTLVDHVHAGFR